MSHLFDKAQQLEALYRDLALKRQLQRVKVKELPDEDETGRYCLDCGALIALSRLAVLPDAVRCTECETTKESRCKI